MRKFASLIAFMMVFGQMAAHAGEPMHITRADVLEIDGQGYTPAPYAIASEGPKGDWASEPLPRAPRPRHALGRLPQESEAPTRTTWYRAQLVAPADAATAAPTFNGADTPLYLYIPRWKSDGSIAVYGNGRLLYQSKANLQWNGSNHPLFIALDTTADAPPPRELLIRLQHLRGIGGALSSLWVGQHADLAWRYTIREWLQTQLPFMCSAAFLSIGVFACLVWRKHRHKKLYLLFFLMSLAAFVRTLHEHAGVERLPISDAWFGWLTVNALFWLLALSHLFLVQLHGRARPWLARLVLLVAAASTLITLPLPGMPDATLVAAFLYIALLLVGGVAFALDWHDARRSRSKDGMLLAGWSLMFIPLGIYDWLLQNNLRNIEGTFLTSYSNMGAFILFSYALFHRYRMAIAEVEHVNASLESRLQAREAELTLSHQRLREIEQRQTLAQERQRLMQDMHDGLGSSLASALRVVEKGRLGEADVAQVLKGCIDDLKLAIDSMEPVDADLLLLLATLRFRLGPRLESTGIALRWEVNSVPPLDWLDPKHALHILRILQEAFTNIIKHTQATEIHLSTAVESDWVVVRITDNGQGFAVEQALQGGGKGLSNQQRRAQAIGAKVDWETSIAGTCFHLHLPLQPSANGML